METTAAPTATPSPKRPLDLTIFGILFVLSAPVELSTIIGTGWKYPVKFFGVELAGIWKTVWLAAHPLLHAVIGYGFLTMRRWAYYLTLVYAAEVLTSAAVRYVMHGFGVWRTVFLVALTPFVLYVVWRRHHFVR
jgi:hypothetical protein